MRNAETSEHWCGSVFHTKPRPARARIDLSRRARPRRARPAAVCGGAVGVPSVELDVEAVPSWRAL